jgi:hypothetical protein
MTDQPRPAAEPARVDSRADVDPRSILLITLDSCRYDTFVAADAPNLKALGGEVHRAQAPSHFTYASHMAMWVGATPGVAGRAEPYINPKFTRIFRIANGGRKPYGRAAFELEGRNIVDGFRQAGYRTIGSGALGWFNPETPVGAAVTGDFERLFYHGWPWSVERQVAWVTAELDAAVGRPVFVFMNIGETHTPYWHEGSPWPMQDNPCRPFQTVDRRAECAERQRGCLEYVDAQLAPLLARFASASAIITADHGDCWGEDGLWEHGVSHAATLTVPLVFRVEPEIDRIRNRLNAIENAYAVLREAPNLPAAADVEKERDPVKLDSVVSLREDLICEGLDGEVIILDPVSRQYHSAGATGSCIIELMDGGKRVADIVAELIGMYNVDRRTCVEEVLAFLRVLEKERLLA